MRFFIAVFFLLSIHCHPGNKNKTLKFKIENDPAFAYVRQKALEVVSTGFNAGDGYSEVWIRDFNTFLELSAQVFSYDQLKENLLVFFRLQGTDGNIVDGFIPKSKARETEGGYQYIYTDLEPDYCGHKNTVETDHETSLIQAVCKLVVISGNREILSEKTGEKTVAERMDFAIDFLMNHRWSDKYGLIFGATTADWGDVQHSHPWGVTIDENTRFCVDIYDNAMLLIALDNLIELLPDFAPKWTSLRNQLAANIMAVLWDEENRKFIPHIYLEGSPYPDSFNEREIYYHGGTAVAIEAGLLDTAEVLHALHRMIDNVHKAGAASIGLTLYPPYPDWAFENKGMYPYGYQNGGDWTWFGGRMIQQLIRYGLVEEAYEQIQPMVRRVVENEGFFEWYTPENQPMGSGTFRGSAGVLFKAIELFEKWAKNQ